MGKDARLVIGAVIIKHKLCLSDVETVLQIQENPYLQYFVGLPGFQMEAPFAPSLFVDIRKRMGQAVFDDFHQAIIDVHDGFKERPKVEPEKQDKHQQDSTDTSDECASDVSEGVGVGPVDDREEVEVKHQSSSPWELPPQALTETYVKLSLHTALIVQTLH